jgi:hypothetical protein
LAQAFVGVKPFDMNQVRNTVQQGSSKREPFGCIFESVSGAIILKDLRIGYSHTIFVF